MSDKPQTSLESVIQIAIDSALKEVHTCLPAVVTRVNSPEQLIDAQITIKRKMAGKLVLLPLLVNVPIRYWRSKTFSITFPIEVGDHVKIMISERSIDTWLTQGGIQDPFDIRKFSLSDAFAEPVMYPQTDLIPDFSPSDLEIKTNSGNTKIIVSEDKVQITNDAEVTGYIQGSEESDPPDPPDDNYRIWQSTGSGLGDIGDVLIKVNSGGTTKWSKLATFSSMTPV